MGEIHSYRDLIVWQKAVDWVAHIYRIGARFPASENFGLTSQLRRAAVSVPANIAEGHARTGNADYPRFLRYALGSLNETETHLEIAIRLGYLSPEALAESGRESDEIRRMLVTLIRRLESRP